MICNRETARQKIVQAIENLRATAPLPNVLVEYEGQTSVNVSTVTQPYVKVWIDYIDGMQIGLGPNSGDRAMGSIIIEARQRQGVGMSVINNLLTHFYKTIHRSDDLFPVRTRSARHASPPPMEGWVRVGVAIPFWWDNLVG